MNIAEIFRHDLDRDIKEIIKVDDADLEDVVEELQEYVVTEHILDSFVELLDEYQESIQKPNERVNVWISGFFGSGKSSFAKVLGYILANPDLGGPHANLGVIYRQSGKVNESVAELEQATKLSPRQPIYLNQLGIAYRQQGQFAQSRDAYQRALALDPGYAAALLNLGILYDLYLGDTARALDLYGRYLAVMPNGDATVTKWVADLKNRKPGPITVSRQEKP
jgi:tetratricopeptide (TPR) repeat protein